VFFCLQISFNSAATVRAKFLTVQIKKSAYSFQIPYTCHQGRKRAAYQGTITKKERILLGNIRSEEKRRVRFNKKYANDLFLKFSLHDKLLAETRKRQPRPHVQSLKQTARNDKQDA